jgi:hypothetical protein
MAETGMNSLSHRDYFRTYRLNVEQYGEILVAQAFGGEKLGDAQPGYDIDVGCADFAPALRTIEIDTASMDIDQNDRIRIEVKSKLSRTSAGNASVVHCSDRKLSGARSKIGIPRAAMTHLAILLVNPGSRTRNGPKQDEGLIENAWLLSAKLATQMRVKEGKTQYISVRQLKSQGRSADFCDIAPLLKKAADARLENV